MDLEKLTSEERLIAEQAILNFRSLNKACDEAKDGTVLALAEKLALIQGRKLIQQTLQTSLELQARAIGKKSEVSRACSCGRTKAQHGRQAAPSGVARSKVPARTRLVAA